MGGHATLQKEKGGTELGPTGNEVDDHLDSVKELTFAG